MLVATMTAFTFTSCEDVPAAYEIPGGGNGGNGGSTTEVPTLYSEAFDDNTTAFEFKDVNLTGGLTRVWKVASYNNNGYLNASAFLNNASHASESWAVSPAINLSDSKKAVLAFSHAINKLSDVSTMKDMMTVWASTDYTGDVSTATWKQLVVPNYPAGTSWTFVESGDIDLTEYCGNKVYIGFKYTSTDENSGGWEVDNFTIKGDGTPMVTPGKPDTPETTGTPKGTGTKDDPFNSVAANNEAKKLASGAVSEQGYYIKGKVVSIKEQFSAQYGNASFYISDDGQAGGQFLVFRSLYLGNQKWAEGQSTLKEGDEVVVYGKLTNYMGNTLETAQNTTYLVSLNGKTEGGSTEGGEDKPGTGEDKPGTGGTTEGVSATNGDFEGWTDGKPNNWKPACTAGNATLSQSTDAHSGKYSVKVAGTDKANKRLSYKELDLKAGEYTMTFYVKAASATGASVRPGYVKVTNGAVGSYMYGEYTNDIKDSEWVMVTYTFTLDADCTVCLVMMNSKKPGGDVLVDDFKLVSGSEVIIK